MPGGERPFRVLVVDDEPPARERLARLVRARDDAELVGEASDGEEALALVEELGPDLVLMDVRMPGLSGIDVLRRLSPEEAPAVILVTAFDDYAVEAFEVAAVDYLVKPYDPERFTRAFERARDRIRAEDVRAAHERLLVAAERMRAEAKPEYLERIGIESGGRIHVVPVEEIDYVKANGNYVDLHVAERVHLVRESLTGLEERLSPDRFCRIHRGALVNLDRVRAIRRGSYGDCTVELSTGTTLKVSRTYRDRLAEALGIEL